MKHFFLSRGWQLALLALLAIGFSVDASAQLSTATLSGTITDSTGAAIPGASITLTQTDTNFVRVAKSKEDGSYHEEFLPIGPYKISVTSPGFKKLDRSGISLSVMQNAALDLQLEIGTTGETIEVTADIPLVNTGNSTLGSTVSNVEIDNLPLVNRNVDRLLQLVPGVQTVQTVNNLGYQEVKVLINGSTDGFVGQVSYYLDGGLNMTGLRNSGNQVPNPDAISQFNVVTNNYSAQLGKYSAGVVSVVAKSGSNAFHGSAFEFFRDRNFNSGGFNTGGAAPDPYNLHRFGGTLGGPIRRDKDFFFASFGALRFRSVATNSGNLPSDAQIAGNFSENLPSDITKCNQSPSSADNTNLKFLVCDPKTGTPFAGNIIPASRLDPTAVNVIKYVKSAISQEAKMPTRSGDTPYTYRVQEGTPEKNEEYLIKTDHQITPSHRLSLSYFLLDYSKRINLGGFTQKWSYSDYANKQQNANISDTWTISGRTINQFWVNYTRQNGGRKAVSSDPSKKTLADFGSDFGVVGTPSLPNISVGGVEGFTLAQAITGPKAGANVYGVRDVLSTTRGHHTLYFGGEAGLEKDFLLTSLNNYGSFTFSTTNGSSFARSTNALSDFMLGVPAGMGQDTGLYANANYFNFAAFAQDDWHIVPRLTLNLGLRYDWQQAPTDNKHMQTNFTPGVQSHAFNASVIGTNQQLAPLGMLFPGDPGVPKGGVFTPLNHISPRLGFAYDAFGDGKTVLHGAAGLFFGGISGNEWEFPSNYAPYAVRNNGYTKVQSLTHPYSDDPSEFPTGTNPYPLLAFDYNKKTATFLPLNQVVAFDPHYRWPYSIQLNFGIQQQLTNSLAFSIYYVGSLNRKSPLYNDINGPVFNLTAQGTSGASCSDLTKACGYTNAPMTINGKANQSTVNNRRPLNSMFGNSAANPMYSNVWIIRSNQNSNYNGLQISVEQRITHRVSAKGYYTWSKTLQSNALDSTSGLNGVFVDANYPELEYGQRSDQDRRHMMTMSFVWKPDYFDHYNRFVRTALNGWTVTGIWTANSGQPFTVTTGNDNYFSGNGNNRPSIIPGKQPHTLPNSSRVAERKLWFDTSAYCKPGVDAGCPGVGPAGYLGNTRPAQLDVPGYKNVDASLFRSFAIREQLKFQLRGEVSNVFNFVNLGGPSASMTSSTFGQITGSGGSQRIIQVGGRILF
jgi:outer membrane receptor protein involved in Fe transport